MRRSRWNPSPDVRPPGTAHQGALLALLLITLAGAIAAGPLAAQEANDPPSEGGPECCLLLLVPVGARASSLGGAITALSGAEAVFRNPAGIAALDDSQFLIHHSDMALDQQLEAFSLLITPFSSTFGISYQLFDKGEIQTTDPTGQPTGQLTLRDHLLVGSFALRLGAGISAGLNYKVFQQRVDCTGLCGGQENVATTQAIDVGVRWTPLWHPALEVGVSVVNAGLALQVVNAGDSDPFPGRIHFGVAYDVLQRVPTDSLLALRLSIDARDQLAEPGSPVLAVGMELDVQRAVFLRAGYTPGEGLGTGAAVGLELRYNRFDIGVSRSFVNSSLEAEGEPFQVSLGLHF